MPGPEYIVVDAGLPQVSIVITTRLGGGSKAPYTSLNLALHVEDEAAQVRDNRDLLVAKLGLKSPPLWLDQIHGVDIVSADESDIEKTADGAVTKNTDSTLAIMTADCLPIVLWDRSGRVLCALHAGWRGLADGILKRGSELLGAEFSAFIGPGIGACHYEVDDVVWRQFSHKDAFRQTRPGHYRFDLAGEARRQLVSLGAKKIESMNVCTACDKRFYSYRRDGQTGRFATLAWLNESVDKKSE